MIKVNLIKNKSQMSTKKNTVLILYMWPKPLNVTIETKPVIYLFALIKNNVNKTLLLFNSTKYSTKNTALKQLSLICSILCFHILFKNKF